MRDIESERQARAQAVRFLLYPVIFSPDLALEADRVFQLFRTYPHDQIAAVIQDTRAELEQPMLQVIQIERLVSKPAEHEVRAYLAAVVGRLEATLTSATKQSESGEAQMTTLRIEHPVPNFDVWKKAFDSDPARRKESGVRRYRVLRPVDDPRFVTVDLEFTSSAEAEAFRDALTALWRRVEGTVVQSPQAQILETVESKEY